MLEARQPEPRRSNKALPTKHVAPLKANSTSDSFMTFCKVGFIVLLILGSVFVPGIGVALAAARCGQRDSQDSNSLSASPQAPCLSSPVPVTPPLLPLMPAVALKDRFNQCEPWLVDALTIDMSHEVWFLRAYGLNTKCSFDGKMEKPLHIAIYLKNPDLFKACLRYDWDIMEVNENGQDLIDLLHEMQADPDSKEVFPEMLATMKDSYAIFSGRLIKDLISKNRVDNFQKLVDLGNGRLIPDNLSILQNAAMQPNKTFLKILFERFDCREPSDVYKYQILLKEFMREGDLEMVDWFAEKGIILDDHSLLSTAEIESCYGPSVDEQLSSLSLEQIDLSSLMVVQNGCTAIVRTKEGDFIKIKNAKASVVRDKILSFLDPENKTQQQATTQTLTLYLSPGHGFLRLSDHSNVKDGIVTGFYPEGISLLTSGNYSDETPAENDARISGDLRLVLQLTPAQAKAAENEIYRLNRSCSEGVGCPYHLLYGNCVDFVQSIYAAAGGAGHFGDYIDEDQVLKSDYLYDRKAQLYAVGRSRGMISTLAKAMLGLI